MTDNLPTDDFRNSNELCLFGTPGNKFGDTMIGGKDAQVINDMMKQSFEDGCAGVGEALIKIGDYKGRSIYEQKAADQIRISLDDDGNAYVKLIVRDLDPGKGLLALAGGFKDAGETDAQAADREESEEAKSDAGIFIAKYEIPRHPVKGDVRLWSGPDRADGVKNGDIIAMSTVAMIPVVKNAHDYVEAGDDASSAGWVTFSDLQDANVFGIKGHAAMLFEAAHLSGVSEQFPQSFEQSLMLREQDIVIATDKASQRASILLRPNI